jgi:hypothetical protein
MMPPGEGGRIDRKLIHRSAWKINSRKLRCIASFEHLWRSLTEVGCLRVISEFPDYLVIPKTADASVGYRRSRPIGPSFASRPARGQSVRPCNTRAQMRQPNAAVDATARAMFHRTQLASKRSRTAARSAMRSGSPAAASSLSSPPCRSRHRSAHLPVRGRRPLRRQKNAPLANSQPARVRPPRAATRSPHGPQLALAWIWKAS